MKKTDLIKIILFSSFFSFFSHAYAQGYPFYMQIICKGDVNCNDLQFSFDSSGTNSTLSYDPNGLVLTVYGHTQASGDLGYTAEFNGFMAKSASIQYCSVGTLSLNSDSNVKTTYADNVTPINGYTCEFNWFNSTAGAYFGQITIGPSSSSK
jgi:hypothetical protein